MHFEHVTLPQGWNWRTVDDLKDSGRSLVSGPFGSNIGSRFFVPSGVPVIRGNNLKTGLERFIDSGFVYLTDEKAAEFPNCVAHADDLVLTAAGTIGQVGIIPRQSRFPQYIISNKQLRARFDRQLIRPLFAYYWLATPLMCQYIQSRNTGSTIPLINLSVLKSLPLPVPPITEQDGILQVLDAIDRRIWLLDSSSQTIERVSRAIFKSWFVDFDPVRAKAKGREPEGMEAATASLFPSELHDTPDGFLPAGWGYTNLKAVTNLITRGISPRYADEGLLVLNQKCVRDNKINPLLGRRHDLSKTFSVEKLVRVGDILVNSTGVGHSWQGCSCDRARYANDRGLSHHYRAPE